MKTLSSYTNHYSALLLLVVIAAGLLNTDFFYNQTTFAYYGFCFSALLFVTTPSLYINNYKLFTFTKPMAWFSLWVLYISIQYGYGFATPYYWLYFIVLFIFFFKACLVLRSSLFHFHTLFKGIAILSVLESGYCLAQYFGFFISKNNYFAVTGTWTNPNVTALFLTLTIPAFLFLFKTAFKKYTQIGFIIVLLALVILKCRAAYIGSVLILLVYYGLEYSFLSWIKDKKNNITVKALIVLCFIVIIPVTSNLYHTKKASADGRVFIWKVAAQMAVEKPFTGYGYGYFPREYNLFQSQYIREGKATASELQNVAIINMPHNELLQQLVEGGILGLVLMVLFFGTLLGSRKTPIKANATTQTTTDLAYHNSLHHLSYAAVIAFIAMFMVNTTLIVAPVMGILLLYAAILSSPQSPMKIGEIALEFRTNKIHQWAITTILVALSTYLLYLFVLMAWADRQNKIAFELKEQGKQKEALTLLNQLESKLLQDSDYWSNRANSYYRLKNYPATIACFQKASRITTEAEFYLGIAASHKKLKQYPEAIAEYEKLILLKPSKFMYRFELMKLHIMQKDTLNALQAAQGIVNLKPKIPSPKVVYYKKIAHNVIFKLNKNTPISNPKNALKTSASRYNFLKNDSK